LWEKTLLIVFYDEHGGFFDHVPPPEAPDDDSENFGNYGVRVPAMIVSPWVPPRIVSKTVFDHTSIIKSILLRFCAGDLERRDRRERLSTWLKSGHPRYMGTRVANANDVGELLTNDQPRPAPDHEKLVERAAHRATARDQASAADQRQPEESLSDLQKRVLAATKLLRSRGHPTARP
jgi:phospholipase C